MTKNQWSASETDWEKINLNKELDHLTKEVDGCTITEHTFLKVQINSAGKYHYVSGSNGGNFYPVEPSSGEYVVTAQEGKSTQIAILQNINNIGAGVAPAFSQSFPSRIVIPSGTSYKFGMPEDGNYIYMISQPESSTYDVGTIIKVSLFSVVGELGNEVVDAKSDINDIAQLADLSVEVDNYTKQQVAQGFDYVSGKLYDATDSLGKSISEVTKANASGYAYIYKIPINGKTIITYPVFLTSGGYGCLVTNKNDVVIAQYANSTLPTGTEKTISTTEDAAFFYFSSPNSISTLSDYTLTLKGSKVAKESAEDMQAIIKWLPFLSNLTEESNDSLCLAAIKTRIVDDKIPFHSGYLFHKLPNDDGKLFYGTKLDNAEQVCVVDYSPKGYVLAVSPKDGTIIAAIRDSRADLRVYHNGQNYTVAAKSSDNEVSPKGWLYNSGVEFINVNGTEYCLFAEYDGTVTDNQLLHIWKGTYPYTTPSDWKTVYSKTTSYNSGSPTAGSITHFHMIRRDPWTNILYCTTGDFPGQFFWLYSTDNGETWETLATDHDISTKPDWASDGQPLRCINFVFTENYIYFATDHGNNNTLSRIGRNANTGIIDITTRERLSGLPYGIAVNTLCYVESPNGLFMFTRIDTGYDTEYDKPIPVLFWSFAEEKLYTVASIKQLTNSWGGHRGKCYMNYTNGQESRPAMGFAGNAPCQFDLIGANGNNIGTIFYEL